MSSTYFILAVLSAMLLPCTWYQARNPESKMPAKGLWLLGTCLLSGLLVYCLLTAMAG